MLQNEIADDLRNERLARGEVPPHRDGEPNTVVERFGDGHRVHCSCGVVGEVMERDSAYRARKGHREVCEERRDFIGARRERRRKERAERDEQWWIATKAYAKREHVCISGVTRERVNGETVYSWYCLCGREAGTSHGTRLAAQQARDAHVARFLAAQQPR